MIEIKDLLAKFRNILGSGEEKKRILKKILLEVVGLDVDTADMEIKNNTVYLNIKPIYKNEVLLKQDKIFSKLEEIWGSRAPHSIR
ncbi:MAG TPA: hypothetical protein VJB95_00200 [Candidatus Paceibacterota bacterium]